MVFRTFFGLIVPLAFSCVSLAKEVELNPSHPDRYKVVEGDTLWDISGKFLKNPSQWPELWSYNSQIQNPHLIYPGDTVYFSIVEGKPRLSFSSTDAVAQSPSSGSPCVINDQDVENGRTSFALSDNGKIQPCIRESDVKQAVKLIPSEAIAKYLSSPRVVNQQELDSAPYVVDFAGEHLIAGKGDKIYVRSIEQANRASFTVYRPGDTYVDPVTKEVLGFEAKYVAESELVQLGDPATLTVTDAKQEILIGDRIMEKGSEEIVLNYFPKPPEESIKGSIIGVLDGVSQIGRYNVVVIDKGTVDGVQTGHELDILQRGRIARDPYSPIKNDMVQLPDERAGKLMVFRPFERMSYALVMQANQAIHVSDKIQTP